MARSIIKSALGDVDRPKDSAYLFTTTGETPVSGFAKAKRRLDAAVQKHRKEAAAREGIEVESMLPWTIHDLRTTFNTIACERLKIDASVAYRILNHVATATTSKIMRVYDMMAMMVMASPTFKSDYFTEQTLETVFAAFVEGLAVAKDELGAQRYQSLIELTAKARALFESDPWEKTGAAKEGQRILWAMEDLLREG